MVGWSCASFIFFGRRPILDLCKPQGQSNRSVVVGFCSARANTRESGSGGPGVGARRNPGVGWWWPGSRGLRKPGSRLVDAWETGWSPGEGHSGRSGVSEPGETSRGDQERSNSGETRGDREVDPGIGEAKSG
ncbi:hypothetical protein L6452_26138 [Arctium lappa]|uniref:Uncharacterized protein n=1 Tax=Arctium lappa TaxID=4217 RepID=A0ACB9ABD5_ARCLA|nr:hypothetical protein L6452_26138 [Arctium lappa]